MDQNINLKVPECFHTGLREAQPHHPASEHPPALQQWSWCQVGAGPGAHLTHTPTVLWVSHPQHPPALSPSPCCCCREFWGSPCCSHAAGAGTLMPADPPTPKGDVPPSAPQEEFTYAKHASSPQRSARSSLTNPNSCSAVPSAVVTDGCCEQRGVAVGNNQNNGSMRLQEQRWCSQPSSARILLWISAGSRCSPGWLAAAPAPGPGDVGCQE